MHSLYDSDYNVKEYFRHVEGYSYDEKRGELLVKLNSKVRIVYKTTPLIICKPELNPLSNEVFITESILKDLNGKPIYQVDKEVSELALKVIEAVLNALSDEKEYFYYRGSSKLHTVNLIAFNSKEILPGITFDDLKIIDCEQTLLDIRTFRYNPSENLFTINVKSPKTSSHIYIDYLVKSCFKKYS